MTNLTLLEGAVYLLVRPLWRCYQSTGSHLEDTLQTKDGLKKTHSRVVNGSWWLASLFREGATRKREQKTTKQNQNPAMGYFPYTLVNYNIK